MNLIQKIFGKRCSTGRLIAENEVVLFTSPSCTCSQDALELLHNQGLTPRVVQLEDHPEIRKKYGAGTPIVAIDGRIRFHGRVDAVLLGRLVEHRCRKGE